MACVSACTSSAPAHAEELATIFFVQDQRYSDRPTLSRQVRHSDARVRLFAVRALGAMRHREAVEPLIGALRDRDPLVARAAIFALGLQPGHDRWSHLASRAVEATPEVCAAVLASLREADRSALTELPRLITSSHEEIAGQAALALLRLLGDRTRAARDRVIEPTILNRAHQVLGVALSRCTSETARWRLTYALAHLRIEAAETDLITIARRVDESRYARVFAMRGLGELRASGAIRNCLMQLVADDDPVLAVEAVRALARPHGKTAPRPRYRDMGVVQTLLASRLHRNVHVRARASRLLGGFTEHAETIVPRLSMANSDALSGDVALRWASLEALGQLGGDGVLQQLLAAARESDWRVRVGAVRGLACRPAKTAIGPLAKLLRDPDVRVRTAALEALPAFKTEPRALELCLAAADDGDLAIRETLGTVLGKFDDRRAIPTLIKLFEDSTGLAFAESRKLFLRSLKRLDPNDPRLLALLHRASHDVAFVVRREVDAQLKALRVASRLYERRQGLMTPRLGVHMPWSFLESKPIVRMVTTRGVIDIELFPASAPVHCFNWLALIDQGLYDGRPFHRVVPNFVVQGGDHRGDGFGARGYHGGQIRDEINDTPYLEGTLGMPKTDDDDTGGDQFFITGVPTPHLDRRYSVFGRVSDGLGVLERLRIGDRIDRIFVLTR